MIALWPVLITVDEDTRRRIVARLERAIVLAGYTEQQACLEMGLGQNQFGAQKSGEGHLSLTRLMLVPRVLVWFSLLTLQEEGMPPEVRKATRVGLTILGSKQMARMALPQRAEQKVG